MTASEEPTLQELDGRLRELEADGERDGEEFRRLSEQRQQLLNERDDAE